MKFFTYQKRHIEADDKASWSEKLTTIHWKGRYIDLGDIALPYFNLSFAAEVVLVAQGSHQVSYEAYKGRREQTEETDCESGYICGTRDTARLSSAC